MRILVYGLTFLFLTLFFNEVSALSGSGTEIAPFLINDVNDLKEFRDDVNEGDSFTGVYFKLTNDIVFNGSDYVNVSLGWGPINDFNGVFDGGGFTIFNLFINRSDNSIGLFSYLHGTVTNLGLENVNINGGNYVGAFAGENFGGSIIRSYSSGIISGESYVGGLIGNNGGSVSESYSDSNVFGNNFVGGLIGFDFGSVSGSYSEGDVEGGDYVGGLIGENTGSVSDSYSSGTVKGNDYVGGLIGDNGGSVSDSYSDGSVKSTGDYVGGLMGGNYGSVTGSYSKKSVNGKHFTGGLIGHNRGSVSNSYSESSIYGLEYSIGGLIGDNEGSVTDSFSSGSVNGKHGTGGLIGDNRGSVIDSYSSGSVGGRSWVGGLMGSNSGSVTDSYSEGDVGGGDYVGGLIGENTGSVSGSYSSGSVKAALRFSRSIGGLIGSNSGSVTNSYSSGSVGGEGILISSSIGGLIGSNSGSVSGSYYDNETSGQNDTDRGIPKMTSELQVLKTGSNLYNDWSSSVWDFSEGKYPQLIEFTDYKVSNLNGFVKGFNSYSDFLGFGFVNFDLSLPDKESVNVPFFGVYGGKSLSEMSVTFNLANDDVTFFDDYDYLLLKVSGQPDLKLYFNDAKHQVSVYDYHWKNIDLSGYSNSIKGSKINADILFVKKVEGQINLNGFVKGFNSYSDFLGFGFVNFDLSLRDKESVNVPFFGVYGGKSLSEMSVTFNLANDDVTFFDDYDYLLLKVSGQPDLKLYFNDAKHQVSVYDYHWKNIDLSGYSNLVPNSVLENAELNFVK